MPIPKRLQTQPMSPSPNRVDDLLYDELKAVLETVMSAMLPESDNRYYVEWLKQNLPGSYISDLIYWPNEWFNDEKVLHVELTADQILAYAMAKSGRRFADAPKGIELPYPLPEQRRKK